MKRTALLVVVLSLLSSAARAGSTGRPDYSKETLFIFSRDFVREQEASRVEWNLGAIDVFHFGTRLRVSYLPFLAPLPGSRLKDVATFPNPFELTQTAIARSMPYMPDERPAAVRREIRRALKMEKKAKIQLVQ
ncbi:MAG: hypothetical protein ABIP63_03590 [Thermoanaerobaculia bacterium]